MNNKSSGFVKLQTSIFTSNSKSMTDFPDFFIVGPQRTGTTWLANILAKHPNVLFSNPKEIYFFNLISNKKHPLYKSSDLEWYLQHFRISTSSFLKRYLKCIINYRKPFKPLTKGEGTASYSCLDKKVIEDLKLLNPNLKIILIIRNPIKRAWSHLLKDLVKNSGQKFDDLTQKEIISFLEDPYQIECGNYVKNIEKWTNSFGSKRLHIINFDDLAQNPKKVIFEVAQYLEIPLFDRYLSSLNLTKINSTRHIKPIIEPYYTHLEKMFQKQITEIHSKFGINPQL